MKVPLRRDCGHLNFKKMECLETGRDQITSETAKTETAMAGFGTSSNGIGILVPAVIQIN